MSEELTYAAGLCRQIYEQQDSLSSPPVPLEAHVVQKFGKLAVIDPYAALDAAEDVASESSRVNAFVQIGEHTGVSGDLGPIVDAWQIAQSEVLGSEPEPAKRARKLNFLFRHALPLDRALATDIAESIESPFWRARSLLDVAVEAEDSELLKRVDYIAGREGLRKEINDGIMGAARRLGEYRTGINAVERRIDQAMGSTPNWTAANYGVKDAAKDWSSYVLSCVLDAVDKGQTKKLLPISDEVAEAFTMYAEFQEHPEERVTFDFRRTYGYGQHRFDELPVITQLAALFDRKDPEASLKLLRTARKLINIKVKQTSVLIAERKRNERQRTLAKKQSQRPATLTASLLDMDEIAIELGLDQDFEAELASLEIPE